MGGVQRKAALPAGFCIQRLLQRQQHCAKGVMGCGLVWMREAMVHQPTQQRLGI